MRKPLFLVIALGVIGCAPRGGRSEPPYLAALKAKGPPPLGPVLDFEEDSFPPVPKGVGPTTTEKPDIRPSGGVPLAERVTKARGLALQDTGVTSALGPRYVALAGGLSDPDKDHPTDERAIALNFYSYSGDRAYRVLVRGGVVASIEPRPVGYQPPETRSEVAAAAEIVKRDERYRGTLRSLSPRGLQAPSPDGHRRLYLQFYEGDKRPARFGAMVDMTLGRIVTAGPIRERLP